MAHPGYPDHYFLLEDIATGDSARIDLGDEDTGPTPVFHRLCRENAGQAKRVLLRFGRYTVDQHDCRTPRTEFYVHILRSD